MYFRISKTRIEIIIELLLVLAVLLMHSVYVQEGVNIVSTNMLQVLIYMCVFTLIMLNIKRIDAKHLILMMLTLFGYCIFVILHFDSFNIRYTTTRIVFPIIAFVILHNNLGANGISKLLIVFVNTVCIIAAVSLFFWMFGAMMGIIKPTKYYVYSWSIVSRVPSYYGLYFDGVPKYRNFNLFAKNCGIFPEPPMFMVPLCAALGFQTFYLPHNLRKQILLIITILTTVSTTGFLVLILFFGYQWLFSIDKKGGRLKRLIRITSAIPVAIILILVIAFLLTSKSTTGSFSVRNDHLNGCMNAFLHSGFMGIGFTGNTRILVGYYRYEQGTSVGLPYLLAAGGIELGALFVIPFIYSITISVKKEDRERLILSIMYFIIYFMTAITGGFLLWFLTVFIFASNPYAMGQAIPTRTNPQHIRTADLGQKTGRFLSSGIYPKG